MSTIVPVADAAQFLSVVPRLLGFTPTRSVVVVPLRDGRSVGALRVDLPPGDPGPLVSTTIGMLCRLDGVDAFVTVVYTDEPVVDGLPRGDLAAALGRAAAASGLRLVDVLVVAADGWGSHVDAGAPPVRSLDELMLTGTARGDQSTGAELPAYGEEERAEVDAALRSLRASVELLCGFDPDPELDDGLGDAELDDVADCGCLDGECREEDCVDECVDGACVAGGIPRRRHRIDPRALAAACEMDDLPGLYERALRWKATDLRPAQAAVLAWCLGRPALRDVALVQWSGDIVRGQQALEAQHRWEDSGAEYPVELASVMWGEDAEPLPARLDQALELCRHVAALAPPHLRAGALSVCAWLSWALGRSTHADRYAAMAQAIDPDHGLAEIVRSFVAAGHLPDWAFRTSA
ncbi:DUF4192 family protein [Microbacterium sp. MC2]